MTYGPPGGPPDDSSDDPAREQYRDPREGASDQQAATPQDGYGSPPGYGPPSDAYPPPAAYQPPPPGGYQPPTPPSGYQPPQPGGYPAPSQGGYQPPQWGSYPPPPQPGGYPQQQGGYAPPQPPGYQPYGQQAGYAPVPPPGYGPSPAGYGPPPGVGYGVPGPRPTNRGVDFSTVSKPDWVAMGAGFLALIFSFFAYYSYTPKNGVTVEIPSAGAWHGFFGWFGVLLALVGAASVAAAVFAPDGSLPAPPRLVALIAFAVGLLATVIAIFSVPQYSNIPDGVTDSQYDAVIENGHGFSFWIVLILLIAGTVAAFLGFQQQDGAALLGRSSGPRQGEESRGFGPPTQFPPGSAPQQGYAPPSQQEYVPPQAYAAPPPVQPSPPQSPPEQSQYAPPSGYGQPSGYTPPRESQEPQPQEPQPQEPQPAQSPDRADQTRMFERPSEWGSPPPPSQ